MTLAPAPSIGIIRRAAAARRVRLIAIDGASGTGKSTLATRLFRGWPGGDVRLVRLDDVYPGWFGLEAGAAIAARRLVGPITRASVGSVPRWDWAADRPGAVDHVRPRPVVVIEGCGAFEAVAGATGLRVWLEASDDERKRAALARDGGAFDPYWDVWESQWRRYLAKGRARVAADLVISARGTRR